MKLNQNMALGEEDLIDLTLKCQLCKTEWCLFCLTLCTLRQLVGKIIYLEQFYAMYLKSEYITPY